MTERLGGPALVAVASLLWGTDALFRFPTVERIDPTFIVFVEHLGGLLLLLPWIWKRHAGDLFRLGWKEWLCAAFVGVGGSALATVFFTASFRYLNPSVTILLQKLQPIFTVLLAFAFLGERPDAKFYPWAAVALGAGFVLSFPDLDFGFLRESGNLQAKGVFYALAAAGIWSVSTVLGRRLLQSVSPGVATFWRYAFGLGMLSGILSLSGSSLPALSDLASGQVLVALAYVTVITGLVPMLAYYAGLSRTPASVATFVELLHPVSAVLLNTVFLHTPLSTVQMVAGGILLLAVTLISA